MDYAPNTDEQLQEMLRVIGVGSFDDLIRTVPAELRRRTLDIPAGLTELDVLRLCEGLAAQNQ
ncbi:MAG: glycine dehydrogenase, partial [Candidatus Omnitrophica bacterium CG11_big_fil_rev_8_21_14_0_20_63_9]